MKSKSYQRIRLLVLVIFVFTGIISCKNTEQKNEAKGSTEIEKPEEPFFKISLAQWSLNKEMRSGELDPMDFAKKASELGFDGIEYVTQLYDNKLKEGGNTTEAFQSLLDSLKAKSERYNVENVLIMVDGEGDLATPNQKERNQAIENHKKWIDAAQFLGAQSIRVSLFGSDDPKEWHASAVDALSQLSYYAAGKNINVLVENHGYLSSNARLLVEVIEEVNQPNCGTLPDFGNFCLKREGGARFKAKCLEEYPKYQGVEEMMPYAMAVSAKAHDFSEEGKEIAINYNRMLQIVKDAGYTGYIGIEYEGQRLSAEEGILATKKLLIEEGTKRNPN